jgi:hypothetical protein
MEAALLDQSLSQLESWLAEALAARHDILTGKKVSYVAHQGTQRAYKTTGIAELDQYIASLKSAIRAKLSGDSMMRQPIHPGFGFGS